MTSHYGLRRMSSMVDMVPLQCLFSPTLLDQDLIYVDKTYYPANHNNDKLSILEKYITPAMQDNMLIQRFGAIANLSRLNLQNIGLSIFPQSVATFFHLQTLDLSLNSLSKLPDTFDQLKHLKYLNLSRNKFKELPDILFTMAGILHLDISHNPLDYVSSKISCLSSLVHFDLSHTQVRFLPCEIIVLSMTTIKMDHCPVNNVELMQRNTNQPITLMETCARQLIHPILLNLVKSKRKSKKYETKVMRQLEVLPQHLLVLLSKPKTCSFCGGPYFENHVKRYRIIQRQDDSWVPVEYEMCSAHWNTEQDRLLMMFAERPVCSLPPFHKVCHLKLHDVI